MLSSIFPMVPPAAIAAFLAVIALPVNAQEPETYRLTVLPAAPSPADEVTIRVEAACPGVFDDPREPPR
jgi:hypothetical protein